MDLNGLALYSYVTWAYMLALIIAAPLWIYSSTLWSPSSLLRAGMVVYLLGLAASGLAGLSSFNVLSENGMLTFLTGRVLQGIGMCGMLVWIFVSLARYRVTDNIKRSRFHLMAIPFVYFIGLIAGPYLGAQMVDHFSWRWIFVLFFSLAFAALFFGSSMNFGEKSRKISPKVFILTLFFILIPVISVVPYVVAAFLVDRIPEAALGRSSP
jgi:MFS family permease